MRLQDQAFKNCTKWMQACNEWGSNLDKCLSSLNNLLKTEIPPSFSKIGVQV